MKNILFNPFFGIMLSLMTYQIGKYLSQKIKFILFNPLLIGIILSIFFLIFFNIPYEAYDKGGMLIKILINPVATVVIGTSLHEQFKILKKNCFSILFSVFIGSIVAIVITYTLGILGKFSSVFLYASLPKSVTLAVALDIGNKFGWETSLIAFMTVITGVTGAVIAPLVGKFIKYPVARGLAIGTSSHVIGTSKALELGEIEGAMSGLAVGLAAIFTSFLIPILLSFFN